MNKLFVGALITIISLSLFMGYMLLRPSAQLTRIAIGGVTLTVEFAKTPADQEKGLSGRASMPLDHGMLFIFDHEDTWSFWMHEMQFPLDIIWFNSSRQVVFMEQDLQPCSQKQCPAYTPSAPALYVLEVNAGFARTHNITLGTTFAFVS